MGFSLTHDPLEQVHDIFHGAWTSQRASALLHFLDSPGLTRHGGQVEEGKNLGGEPLRRQILLFDNASGAGVLHSLRVAKLMAVGGGSEGDKDGGTPRGSNFRHRDGARPANNQVGLCEPLRHVPDEGTDLRIELKLSIRLTNGIIVAFAGLMHHEKLIFFLRQQGEGVHNSVVDGLRAAAAAGNQKMKRRGGDARLGGEELLANRAARCDRLRAEAMSCFLKARRDASRNAGENAIGETGLGVGLEKNGWNTAKRGEEHHRAGSVAADAERGSKTMSVKNFE